MNGENGIHLIHVFKDGDFVPLSAANLKPMPPGTYNCELRTEPMKMVAYVETNNWDIRNLAQFVLEDSKKPVFDYIVIFAANMNYDKSTGKRYLHFNDKLQPFVRDPKKFTQPLKDRGIKLIVDILPNHQGVGFYNFQNFEEALEFARECKTWADKLGIDGFDIDEEYAQYQVLPSKPVMPGNQSIFWFMRAMKEVMPERLLTLYEYGHRLSPSSEDELGKKAVDYLDFCVSDYNVTSSSQVGMAPHKYGNRSIEASRGYLLDYPEFYINNLQSIALGNLNDCNGYTMVFNIKGGSMRDGSAARGLSEITTLYYGENTIFSGTYYNGPNDN